MTQLESALASALSEATGIDIAGIIRAARGGSEQTVGNGNVTQVVSGGCACKEKKADPVAPPPPPSLVPDDPGGEFPPLDEPEHTDPERPASSGVNITRPFDPATKKLNKDVFLAAVEKANTLASLTALNETCDCGISTAIYTEETARGLKNKLTRWGRAQE